MAAPHAFETPKQLVEETKETKEIEETKEKKEKKEKKGKKRRESLPAPYTPAKFELTMDLPPPPSGSSSQATPTPHTKTESGSLRSSSGQKRIVLQEFEAIVHPSKKKSKEAAKQ
jgi:hypothetical protein